MALKIILIINKVKFYSMILIFHNSDMSAYNSHTVIHIKMVNIFKLFSILVRNTSIIWKNYPYVKFILVQILWQCTNNVCKSACFYKRNTFRCCKQNIFHIYPPFLLSAAMHKANYSNAIKDFVLCCLRTYTFFFNFCLYYIIIFKII